MTGGDGIQVRINRKREEDSEDQVVSEGTHGKYEHQLQKVGEEEEEEEEEETEEEKGGEEEKVRREAGLDFY